jgi:hypothetical protein
MVAINRVFWQAPNADINPTPTNTNSTPTGITNSTPTDTNRRREGAHRASSEFTKSKEARSKALEEALKAAGDEGDASEYPARKGCSRTLVGRLAATDCTCCLLFAAVARIKVSFRALIQTASTHQLLTTNKPTPSIRPTADAAVAEARAALAALTPPPEIAAFQAAKEVFDEVARHHPILRGVLETLIGEVGLIT